MDTTRVLAVIGAVTGTVGTLWALFLSIVYDRARVTVKVGEAWIYKGGNRRPVLWVKLRNRGRRPTHVESVAYVASAWRGQHNMSADIGQELAQPRRLEEGESANLTHGALGGYEHGAIPTKRWFVTDGGGRIFPLRERFRQRVEQIVFWPTRAYFHRKRREA